MNILFIIFFTFVTNDSVSKLPMSFQILFKLKFAVILALSIAISIGIFIFLGIYNENEHIFIAICTLFFTYLSYLFTLSILKKSKFKLVIILILIAFANKIWDLLLKKVINFYLEIDEIFKAVKNYELSFNSLSFFENSLPPNLKNMIKEILNMAEAEKIDNSLSQLKKAFDDHNHHKADSLNIKSSICIALMDSLYKTQPCYFFNKFNSDTLLDEKIKNFRKLDELNAENVYREFVESDVNIINHVLPRLYTWLRIKEMNFAKNATNKKNDIKNQDSDEEYIHSLANEFHLQIDSQLNELNISIDKVLMLPINEQNYIENMNVFLNNVHSAFTRLKQINKFLDEAIVEINNLYNEKHQ